MNRHQAAAAAVAALTALLFLMSCKSDDPAKSGPEHLIRFEIGGITPQGGLLDFAISNADRENPFSGAAPIITSGATIIRYSEVTDTHMTGLALIDPLAPPGVLHLELSAHNPKGEVVKFISTNDDPLAPKISLTRAPRKLTPGTIEPSESISQPRQANVYKASTTNDDEVFLLTFGTVGGALRTTTGTRLVGAVAVDGKFGADGPLLETTFDSVTGSRVAAGVVHRGSPGPGVAFFTIYTSDLSGAPAEYGYSLNLSLKAGVPFSMKEPPAPDAPDKPLRIIDIDAPQIALDGAIDRPGDADYVLFTPKNAGRIFVVATPVGAPGPLNVSIFGNDPGTSNCRAFMAGGIGLTQAEVRVQAGTPYCARINSTSQLTMGYHLIIAPEF